MHDAAGLTAAASVDKDPAEPPEPPEPPELSASAAAFLDYSDVEIGPCVASLITACKVLVPKVPSRAMTKGPRERAAAERAHHIAIACEMHRVESDRAARCKAVSARLESGSSAERELADYIRCCASLLDTVARAAEQQPLPAAIEAPAIAYKAAVRAHQMMGERVLETLGGRADESASRDAPGGGEDATAKDNGDSGADDEASSGQSTPRRGRRPPPAVPKLLINPPWDASVGARRSPPRVPWAEICAQRLKYGNPSGMPRARRTRSASPRSARSNASACSAPSSSCASARAAQRGSVGRRPLTAERLVDVRRADLHAHIDYLAPHGAPDNDRKMGTGSGMVTSQAFIESLRHYPTAQKLAVSAPLAASVGDGDGSNENENDDAHETKSDPLAVAAHAAVPFSGRTHTARQVRSAGDEWTTMDDDLRRRLGIPLAPTSWRPSQLQRKWGEERGSVAKHMERYHARQQELL